MRCINCPRDAGDRLLCDQCRTSGEAFGLPLNDWLQALRDARNEELMSQPTKPPLTREGWIAGLRSGEYRQTTGNLYDGGDVPRNLRGFCCLGLACYLDGVPLETLKGRSVSKFITENSSHGSPLYQRLRITRQMATTLAEKNDTGLTFAQIADLLEGDERFRVPEAYTVSDIGIMYGPTAPKPLWVIRNEDGDTWSNEDGWTHDEDGTRFTEDEAKTLNLPIGGHWEADVPED